jgi:hypothetical protein
VLLPALEAVGAYLSETFQPIWDALVDFFNDTFGPVLSEMSDTFLPALQGAFDGIASAVDTVIGWITDLTDALEDIELPDWLQPGSPTPFEIGLLGIASAAETAAGGIDDMAGALGDVKDIGTVEVGVEGGLADAMNATMRGMIGVAQPGAQAAGMGLLSPAMASASSVAGSYNRTLNMPVTNNIYGGLSAGALQQMIQQALANSLGGTA